MVAFVQKYVFGGRAKSGQTPHIFLVLLLFLVVSSVYYVYLFGSEPFNLVMRTLLTLSKLIVLVVIERSKLSVTVASFLVPTLFMISMYVGVFYYDGDFLIFSYSMAGAMVSLTYMRPKGLVWYVAVMAGLQLALLVIMDGNILGPGFSAARNYVAFLTSVFLNIVLYAFCKAYTRTARSKDIFLSSISHEMRTPTSTVIGISDIELQDASTPAHYKEAFARINGAGRLLLRVINDMLDTAKLKENSISIIQQEYSTHDLISSISHFPIDRSKANIKLDVIVANGMPAYLVGDAMRIEQVVINIVSNAFKYTKAGKVVLEFACAPIEEGHKLYITVTDTGIGMTKQQISNIYKDYKRFHESEMREVGGSGLGMGIVHRFVTLMSGTVLIESNVGSGTKVIISLPQGVGQPGFLLQEDIDKLCSFVRDVHLTNASHGHACEQMPYARVIVVDDLEANLYVAKGLLARYGITAETCESGIELLEKIRSGCMYDLVFLDYMMPGMDGIETMRQLISIGYTGPVVALTADALADNMKKFMDAGFDDLITKPIDISMLDGVLSRYLEVTSSISLEDDAEFEEKLREMFKKTHQYSIARLRKLIDAQDYKNALIIVHNIKGGALQAKESELARVAKDIEDCLRYDNAPEHEAIDILERELHSVIQ